MPITNETLRFLAENRFHNSRQWYLEHKPEYQRYVLEPLKELSIRMAPKMLEIDPQFVMEPKVDRTISRIYRDTRFSHDKSLYREVMWVCFVRSKKEHGDLPGFVFEFSPQGFRYGCGYYDAPPKTMEAMRQLILQDDPSFRRAKRAASRQDVFQMEGDFYKRSKAPEASKALRNWLDRRNIDFMCNSTDADVLFSDDLADKLTSDFALLKPIYEFLCKASLMSRDSF